MPDPGIGVGVGGLIASAMNPGLATSVAQHITPNPNPLAQQGQPGAPGSVDSLGNPVGGQPPPGANLAPAAVTQADPINASYAADLMKYNRMEALSSDLNRNIQGVAAGFGTAQQQHDKQAALGAGGGVGDGLGSLMNIQKMQDQTIQDNQQARFMANASVFAQTLSQSLGRPVSVQEATEIMNNKDTMGAATGAMQANSTLTGTQKDAAAATTEWARANPNATQQQIADYHANLIAGGMGGSDLAQRQYLQERSAAMAAGQTDFPDYLTWQATHTAQAAAKEVAAKQSQEFKDTATQDYSALNTKYNTLKPYIDTLVNDPASAQAALGSFQPTTGQVGRAGPLVSDKVKAAANALQKIQSTMSADALANTKNVRNQREFSVLGQAASGGLNPAASPDDFARTLADLKNKYLDAQATNELAAGHRLTGELVGHGNQDLTSPTTPSGQPNPYYNGGSQDNDFRKMPEADAEAAIGKLPSGARFVGPDGQPYTKK